MRANRKATARPASATSCASVEVLLDRPSAQFQSPPSPGPDAGRPAAAFDHPGGTVREEPEDSHGAPQPNLHDPWGCAMSNWASCTESDSLLLPEDFGEALLTCQILFGR